MSLVLEYALDVFKLVICVFILWVLIVPWPITLGKKKKPRSSEGNLIIPNVPYSVAKVWKEGGTIQLTPYDQLMRLSTTHEFEFIPHQNDIDYTVIARPR